jgi:hypothetical protein
MKRLRWIKHAVMSVLCQAAESWELLVGADASLPLPLPADSRIKVLHRDGENGVQCGKMLLRHAQGKIIAPMCDDDFMLPNRLAETVIALENADLVHFSYFMTDENLNITTHFKAQKFDYWEYLLGRRTFNIFTGGWIKGNVPEWDERLEHLADYGFMIDCQQQNKSIVCRPKISTMLVRQHGGQQSARMNFNPTTIAEKEAERKIILDTRGVICMR